MPGFTIEVDTDLCNGYGNCAVAAPDVFDIDPVTNLAVVTDAAVTEERRPEIEEAEADCPVRAILIRRS
jgi:ferredoxin